jgi:GT2 family glycosyltransferase
MKAVTYGPFPGGWPATIDDDFQAMTAAGFNAIRLFEIPDRALLDAALRHGLRVFGGLKWRQNADFIMRTGNLAGAKVRLAAALKQVGNHPALAGIYVANEIPSDLVRWMGPLKVRHALEGLISLGRELAPHLLFAYANYPSTEYLEPENADFTAFNVYLEEEETFKAYLKRLHHIAGDRPLVISEFGLDSKRNGLETQKASLLWAVQSAYDLETAGLTLYAWSDRWWNNGEPVMDWDFGLVDRNHAPKPALEALYGIPKMDTLPHPVQVSVIVCTRNGRSRIGACLKSIARLTGGADEILVVDDGSVDGTADYVAENFPWVRLLRRPGAGLSAARNVGAAAARGDLLAFTDDDCEPDPEWLQRVKRHFQDGKFAAVGGPNLPPKPKHWQNAVVCAAAGAPSHVMLDDEEAEHLPGCNLVVTQAAFQAIGGFDPQFETAGDDVDFCWRLREAGYRLGFAPGAFVWHWRRNTIREFLRQQRGYGHAERLLMAKHPSRFSALGTAKWSGFIYGGGPVRVMDQSVIYHGVMGTAGYQAIVNRMLPLRGLDAEYDTPKARLALQWLTLIQPRVRSWARNGKWFWRYHTPPPPAEETFVEFQIHRPDGRGREDFIPLFIERKWLPCEATAAWDLEKRGTKVLLATEHGENREKTVLVRVAGKTSTLPFKP